MPRPSLSAVVRISLMPALLAFAGITLMFAMVLLIPYLYSLSINTPSGRSASPRIAQMVGACLLPSTARSTSRYMCC